MSAISSINHKSLLLFRLAMHLKGNVSALAFVQRSPLSMIKCVAKPSVLQRPLCMTSAGLSHNPTNQQIDEPTLKKILGVAGPLQHPDVFYKALAHASWRPEEKRTKRLSWLGDAILDGVVAEALFNAHPDADEGQLTLRKVQLVNGLALADLLLHVGLHEYIQAADDVKVHSNEKLKASVFEAFVAAIFINAGGGGAGYDAARKWITPLMHSCGNL